MTGATAGEVRFGFGDDLQRFLRRLFRERIEWAEASFPQMLGCNRLDEVRMLDTGSGSGLARLVGWGLGVAMHSFDCEPLSAACAAELQGRFAARDPRWRVERGSARDAACLAPPGTFDIVCSWDVLHDTGAMWRAAELATERVAPEGTFWIALCNDQGWVSGYWHAVERCHNTSLTDGTAMMALHVPYLLGVRAALRAAEGRLELEREVARPAEVTAQVEAWGFLQELELLGGSRHSCNELVFQRA